MQKRVGIIVRLPLASGLLSGKYKPGATFPANDRRSALKRQISQLVGSRLIGQPFDDPRYFWGRPSATAPIPNPSWT